MVLHVLGYGCGFAGAGARLYDDGFVVFEGFPAEPLANERLVKVNLLYLAQVPHYGATGLPLGYEIPFGTRLAGQKDQIVNV